MTYTIANFHSRPDQPGSRGALLDLYAEAAVRLCEFIGSLKPADFQLELPANDNDGGSVPKLLHHVVWAARHYADIVRGQLDGSDPGEPDASDPRFTASIESADELARQLAIATGAMADLLWSVSDEDWPAFSRKPFAAGPTLMIHMELLLQHAIAHLDRHRRQIRRKLDDALGT